MHTIYIYTFNFYQNTLAKCVATDISHTRVITHVYLYRRVLLKHQLTGQQFIPSQMQRAA